VPSIDKRCLFARACTSDQYGTLGEHFWTSSISSYWRKTDHWKRGYQGKKTSNQA